MIKEELHKQLTFLIPQVGHPLRMLTHALIELGAVTKLVCAHSQCRRVTREFQPKHKDLPRNLSTMSIDHIEERCAGGLDLPQNLRLVHFSCNSSRKLTDAQKEKISRASKERWKDPDYYSRVTAAAAAGNRTPEASAKRSASMKKHWADPEKKAIHLKNLSRGDNHWQRKG